MRIYTWIREGYAGDTQTVKQGAAENSDSEPSSMPNQTQANENKNKPGSTDPHPQAAPVQSRSPTTVRTPLH